MLKHSYTFDCAPHKTQGHRVHTLRHTYNKLTKGMKGFAGVLTINRRIIERRIQGQDPVKLENVWRTTRYFYCKILSNTDAKINFISTT